MSTSDHSWWETLEAKGGEAVDQVKRLIAAGNVRRIRVRQNDRTVAEFPLTVGLVGAVLAPLLAALGAVAALVTDCSIDVERTDAPPADDETAPAPHED
jgi:hypothetical protein